MQRTLPLSLSVLLLAGGAAAQVSSGSSEGRRVLEAHRAARPSDEALGVFKLDWAGSLAAAKARAAKEGRPILFVSTTQLKDAGDLKGGHC
jgi:hypothetical protein